MRPVKERFDEKWVLAEETGCWVWIAATDRDGYGDFSPQRDRKCKAHRVAWELYREPIPAGMVLDHLCRVRSCVNPDHLRVVTPRQNTFENSRNYIALNAAKTHCIRGHPFSGDNLYIPKCYSPPRRMCRECRKKWAYKFNHQRPLKPK